MPEYGQNDTPESPTCSLDGCDRKRRTRGLCHAHYVRFNRTGVWPADGAIASRGVYDVCTIDGCERKHYAHGYCKGHYERAALTGSPGPADLSRRVSDGYIAVHQRLADKRGKASAHACTKCGGPAKEWAYSHSGIGEITRSEQCGARSLTLTYSMDLDQYEPMCVKCHRAYDTRTRKGRA